MPRPPVATVIPAITPTSSQSRSRSGVPDGENSAESNTTRMSNGFTTPSPAVTKMSAPTTDTLNQYGANALTMR